MSIDATRWAWRVRGISSTQKLVLLALADRASEDHECWPSARRIEDDTELDRKTILGAITALLELGYVRDTGRRRGNGVRVLLLVGVEGREELSTTGPGNGIGTHPENGTGPEKDPSQKRDATHPENGTATHPKNGILNLPMNLKGTSGARGAREPVDNSGGRPAGKGVAYAHSNNPAVVAQRLREAEERDKQPPPVADDATARRALDETYRILHGTSPPNQEHAA